uniref:Rho GDP dissociation inhibitor (GDI) gamma n=1 Tax=Seriola lalandi dorsalis TaxID=1841481 RepID=A0A3B4X4U9_SERLL
MLGLDVCEFGGQVLELLWLTMCYRGLMADKKDLPIEEEEDERNLNYNPPALKSLQEIQELDKDDESLVKYKQTLLGTGPATADLSGPNVWVTRLTLLCDEAPGPMTMDLTGDLSALKEKSFSLQEGVKYRLKIHFKVKREIVAGLRYHHVTYRKGIRGKFTHHMPNVIYFVKAKCKTTLILMRRHLYSCVIYCLTCRECFMTYSFPIYT